MIIFCLPSSSALAIKDRSYRRSGYEDQRHSLSDRGDDACHHRSVAPVCDKQLCVIGELKGDLAVLQRFVVVQLEGRGVVLGRVGRGQRELEAEQCFVVKDLVDFVVIDALGEFKRSDNVRIYVVAEGDDRQVLYLCRARRNVHQASDLVNGVVRVGGVVALISAPK